MSESTTSGRVWFAFAMLIWIFLVASGTHALLRYETTPGTPGKPLPQWPGGSNLPRDPGKFTLVMLAHPDCACTRASLAELELVMAQLHGRLVAFVLLSKPGARPGEVQASELWRKAATIPGVFVQDDRGAEEARQFGGYVSGQAMLYDSQGRLLFSGGITGARGHQGDNEGMDSVIRLVRGQLAGPVTTPVFGCALYDPGPKELREDSSWKRE